MGTGILSLAFNEWGCEEPEMSIGEGLELEAMEKEGWAGRSTVDSVFWGLEERDDEGLADLEEGMIVSILKGAGGAALKTGLKREGEGI